MLCYSCEALVEQEAKAPVVSPHHKPTSPEIRPPVPHGLNQANEFAFIGGELGVAWRDGLAEKGNWSGPLMENGTKTGARRVTLNDEVAVERR